MRGFINIHQQDLVRDQINGHKQPYDLPIKRIIRPSNIQSEENVSIQIKKLT